MPRMKDVSVPGHVSPVITHPCSTTSPAYSRERQQQSCAICTHKQQMICRSKVHRPISIRCQGTSIWIYLPSSTERTVMFMHSREEYIMHESCMELLGMVLVAHCRESKPAWPHTLSPG